MRLRRAVVGLMVLTACIDFLDARKELCAERAGFCDGGQLWDGGVDGGDEDAGGEDAGLDAGTRDAGPPDGGLFLFVGHTNRLAVYKRDPSSGAMEQIVATTPEGVVFASELLAHPTLPVLYVVNNDHGVRAFSFHTGTAEFTPLGSTLGAPNTNRLLLHPSRKWLYASTWTFGGDGGLSGFAIDATSGALTDLPGADLAFAGGAHKLAVIDNHLYAASGSLIRVFAIDSGTGALTPRPPFDSGVEMNSLEVLGTFLYTSEIGPTAQVHGYRASPSTGALTPLPGFPFSALGVTDLLAIPDAGLLLVERTGADELDLYRFEGDGSLSHASSFQGPGGRESVMDPSGRSIFVSSHLEQRIQEYVLDPTGQLDAGFTIDGGGFSQLTVGVW